MVCLFLDFDGVLHPDPCSRDQLFSNMVNLETAMSGIDGIEIVISSDWRKVFYSGGYAAQNVCREVRSPEEMAKHFPESLQASIVGVTPFIGLMNLSDSQLNLQHERHIECLAWLEQHRPAARWIALDDRASSFPSDCEELFLCDRSLGLTHEAALRLRRRLMSLV